LELEDLQAARLKMIWRPCTSKSQWFWMRERYFKKQCFWNTKAHVLDSGYWKQIISMKHHATQCMKKQIGSGQDTQLWYEPLRNEGRIVDLLRQETPQLTGRQAWLVSKLIQNGHWTFSIPAQSPTWDSISFIRISVQADY